MRRATAVVLALVLAAAPAVAGPADTLDDAVSDLRHGDPSRRLAALHVVESCERDALAAQRSLLRRLERLATRDADVRVRRAAVGALAWAGGAEAVDTLVDLVRTERDPQVAQALPRAFRHVPVDAARRPLSELAFADEDPRPACLAAEALGWLPDEGGAGDLRGLLAAAPHWAVTAGACLGLARVQEIDVVDDLVARLRHPDAAVRSAVRDALILLCGVDHGVEPRAWEEWWEAEREGYVFPERADERGDPVVVPADPDGTTSDSWGLDRPSFARFFGIPLAGRRVCLVIDYSQSMWGDRRKKAEEELVDAVKGLSSASEFTVILFNEKVWRFADGPQPARPQQKLDLVAYLPEQETKSYTNVYDAMERALGLIGVGAHARDPAPGLDEMVVLSDGVPNRGRIKSTDRILEAVELLNGGRVRIHTVSLGDEELDLLPALAERNGGRHVRHPFPK